MALMDIVPAASRPSQSDNRGCRFMIFMTGPGACADRMRDLAAVPISFALHPPATLLRTLALPVSQGHVLHVEERGALDGIPAVVLHGGPGSGCSPLLTRFFDPRRYRVIAIDQRGSGRSTPRGSLVGNTTSELLRDLRRVRETLGIAQWLVVGGSWGAGLALAHAAAEPNAVAGLLLRSVFLARTEDIDGFFQHPPTELTAPWQRFAAIAPAARRHDLLSFLAERLSQGDAVEQRVLAAAWWSWEAAMAGASAAPAAPATPVGDALAAAVDRYRVQSHYLLHHCWLDAPPLLARCAALPAVPTLLMHARNDRICAPAAALALHARLPRAQLQWVEDAGHDLAHPAMVSAMVEALDHYAAHGRFDTDAGTGAAP